MLAGLRAAVPVSPQAGEDAGLSGEYRNVAKLCDALGIRDDQILAVGYSDELLRLGA
jgi:hypothetical protein